MRASAVGHADDLRRRSIESRATRSLDVVVRARGGPFTGTWGTTTLHVVPWIGWNQLTLRRAATETTRRVVLASDVSRRHPREVVRDCALGTPARRRASSSAGYLAQTRDRRRGRRRRRDRRHSTLVVDRRRAVGRDAVEARRRALRAQARARIEVLRPDRRARRRSAAQHSPAAHRSHLTMRQSIGRYHQPPTPGDVDPDDGNPAPRQLVRRSGVARPRHEAAARDARVGHRLLQPRHRHRRAHAQSTPRRRGARAKPRWARARRSSCCSRSSSASRSIARTSGARAARALEVLLKRNVGSWFAHARVHARRLAERRPMIRGSAQRWRPFELDQRHNLQRRACRSVDELAARCAPAARVGQSVHPTICRHRRPIDLVQDPWAGKPAGVRLARPARRSPVASLLGRHQPLHRHPERDESLATSRAATSTSTLRRRRDIPGLPIIPFIGVEFLPLL